MNILVAAFEPFDGQVLNPALEALRQLPHEIGKHKLTKLELPTVFYEANDVLIQCVQQKDIDAILTIGQAGGRSALTPERVAINIDDARIPDNKG
ncbi:pyroglutamyl-peptidase I family protein, partial [Staphylococcus arlettae]